MKNITICITSCGELTRRDCFKAIRGFKNQVEIIEIKDVCPQIKALNLMISKVQTEYFIPLDADMILYPDAWNRISEALFVHRLDHQWHSILFPLWDTLTEKKILALKLLRTKVLKENPFKDSPTPDVEHFQRLTNLGYSCIQEYLSSEPIGDHVIKGKRFCYYKFRDVYQTYRTYNFEWDNGAFMGGDDLQSRAKAHFDFFLTKFLETGKKDYLNCIAGMMDGILSVLKYKSKSLGKKKYKIKSNDAIEVFMDWYNGMNSAEMLF